MAAKTVFFLQQERRIGYLARVVIFIMVDRTKKIGYYREAAFEKKKKCKKHFSSERLDLINCHFKCVGECAYSRGAMRGFGSCTYCPDGVCEIKKD